ncbi:MAG: homoserine O-succinyltransferase [Saprospiraceae bacterium]|jgi:homoserine O-succinyltransferase
MSVKKTRLAILDMNNKVPNQGLRCIRDIVSEFGEQLDWKVFDVRGENEMPDLSYDIYICSGGPGSPLLKGEWKDRFYELVDTAWNRNQSGEADKKYFFFICYSFQMACEHFGLCDITTRKKTSFGIYPIHKTKAGRKDEILEGLADPYYAVDSRDWQLIQPRLKVFEEHNAKILSLEKIRTHIEYERAIMAVRFSDEFVGTQFHPEADPEGMKDYFSKEEMKEKIIQNFDEKKYLDMMEHLDDPDKISLTHQTILPHFISSAIAAITNKDSVEIS